MIWFVTALLTGIVLLYLLQPLMRGDQSKLGIVLLVAISASALGLYLRQGHPDLADQPLAPRLAQRQEALGQVAGGVDKLKERLADEPNDVQGWLLLAESEGALGHKAEQQAALEKVINLLPDAAPIKARLQAQVEALKAN